MNMTTNESNSLSTADADLNPDAVDVSPSSNSGADDTPKPRKRWPFKTILEIFPIFMALSALLTFFTTRKVNDVELLTPLNRVLGGLPWWAALLLGAIVVVGLLGIGLATYMFSRAPVGSDDE